MISTFNFLYFLQLSRVLDCETFITFNQSFYWVTMQLTNVNQATKSTDLKYDAVYRIKRGPVENLLVMVRTGILHLKTCCRCCCCFFFKEKMLKIMLLCDQREKKTLKYNIISCISHFSL